MAGLTFSFASCESLLDSQQLHDAALCFDCLRNKYSSENKMDSLSIVLNRQGIIASRLKSYELALEKFKQANLYARNCESIEERGNTFNNIGATYCVLGHLDSAEYYWNLSTELYAKLPTSNGGVISSLNWGALMIEHEEEKLAIEQFRHTLRTFPKDTLASIIVPLNIGNAFINLENEDSARVYLEEALEKSTELEKLQYKIPALLNLGHLYYNMEDYKTSNDYYEAYHELKDSLYNAEISVTIEELENQFELEKEKLALADKELEALRWERTAIAIALVLLLLLTAGVLWYRNRKKVEQARSEAMFEAREKENKRIADLLWKEIGESSKEGKLLLSGQELPENTIPGAIAAARFLNNQQFNPFLAVSLKKALEHLVESLSKRHEIAVKAELVDVQVPMKSRAKHYRAIEKLLLFIVQSKGTSEITFKLAEEGTGWSASFSTDGELNEKDAIWPLSKALVKRIDGKVKLQAQSNTNQIIAKANTN